MKDLSRTRLRSGLNHGIFLAFTFLASVNNYCVSCEQLTQYASQDKEAILLCNDSKNSNLNSTQTAFWTFSEYDASGDMKRIDCNKPDTLYECPEIIDNSREMSSSLRIKKVPKKDDGNVYGVYSCGSSSSVILREFKRPSIKIIDDLDDAKWKTTKKSLRIQEGENVNRIGCFIDGYGLGIDYDIIWKFLPEKNLIDESYDPDLFTEIKFGEMGSFENITVQLHNDSQRYETLEGPANLGIRGSYICEVRFRNPILNPPKSLADVVSTVQFIRVTEKGKEWTLPGIVLLGEIILVGLFTLILTLKERKEGSIEGDYADSEDEEDDPKKET